MPVGVGDGARVTPGEPNNRRAGPGTSYRQTGSLPGSTQFTVTDTACANGYGWVQVDGSGWTATGTASDPWVERWNTSSTTSQTSVEDYVVVHVSGYALRVNPRTCAIQNGAEIIQGEISFFSFQLQNSRNIEEIINSIFDYFELDTGRSDLLRVEIKDSIKAIVPKCSSPYYLIGNLYMDLSGVGNVVFGYFMGMFDSSAGEVISALKQGERDGFGRQWHWFETWIDYPDDRNQRNMGSILARQVSDASQITIDMIIRAAITADLR